MNDRFTPPADDRLHDLRAIARRLNSSIKTVRRLIDRGELGHHRVGRLIRVSDHQFRAYLARTRQVVAEVVSK